MAQLPQKRETKGSKLKEGAMNSRCCKQVCTWGSKRQLYTQEAGISSNPDLEILGVVHDRSWGLEGNRTEQVAPGRKPEAYSTTR